MNGEQNVRWQACSKCREWKQDRDLVTVPRLRPSKCYEFNEGPEILVTSATFCKECVGR